MHASRSHGPAKGQVKRVFLDETSGWRSGKTGEQLIDGASGVFRARDGARYEDAFGAQLKGPTNVVPVLDAGSTQYVRGRGDLPDGGYSAGHHGRASRRNRSGSSDQFGRFDREVVRAKLRQLAGVGDVPGTKDRYEPEALQTAERAGDGPDRQGVFGVVHQTSPSTGGDDGLGDKVTSSRTGLVGVGVLC